MANLVITSTTNTIHVDFNDYTVPIGIKKSQWDKQRIRFELAPSDALIKVLVIGESAWAVAYTATDNCLIIDSVAGVAPTSNSDLYDKLIALLG